MKKIVFIFGLLFGLSLSLLCNFIIDLIMFLKFPLEFQMPSIWGFGLSLFMMALSHIAYKFTPENDTNEVEYEK